MFKYTYIHFRITYTHTHPWQTSVCSIWGNLYNYYYVTKWIHMTKRLERYTPTSSRRIPLGAGARGGFWNYFAPFSFSVFSSFPAMSVFKFIIACFPAFYYEKFSNIQSLKRSKLKPLFIDHLYTQPPRCYSYVTAFALSYVHLLIPPVEYL